MTEKEACAKILEIMDAYGIVPPDYGMVKADDGSLYPNASRDAAEQEIGNVLKTFHEGQNGDVDEH